MREIPPLSRSKGIATALANRKRCQCFSCNGGSYSFHELFFDVIAFGSEVGCGKDRPDLYTYVLSQLKTSARTTIVFEDIPVAPKTAKSLSLITCAVKSDDQTQNMDLLAHTQTIPLAHGTIQDSWGRPVKITAYASR